MTNKVSLVLLWQINIGQSLSLSRFAPSVKGKATETALIPFMTGEILILGVGYRRDSVVDAMARFQINNHIMIGYAYEATALTHYNNGTHEVFLRLELGTVQNQNLTPVSSNFGPYSIL